MDYIAPHLDNATLLRLSLIAAGLAVAYFLLKFAWAKLEKKLSQWIKGRNAQTSEKKNAKGSGKNTAEYREEAARQPIAERMAEQRERRALKNAPEVYEPNRLIGRRAKTAEETTRERGSIVYAGETYPARSFSSDIIPKNTFVNIVSIREKTLVVSKNDI